MPLLAAYDPRHSLNAICPYFTMFPLEFPLSALSRVPDAGIVVDPFCGRGTTLYAARATQRKTFGVDCSPVAVAISKAKLATASKSDVLDLARNLLEQSDDVDLPHGRFWRVAYKPSVLKKSLRPVNGPFDRCIGRSRDPARPCNGRPARPCHRRWQLSVQPDATHLRSETRLRRSILDRARYESTEGRCARRDRTQGQSCIPFAGLRLSRD